MKGLIFLLLLCGVLLKWQPTVDLFQIKGAMIVNQDVYMDPLTGTHHLLFVSLEWDTIRYWQVDRNNAVVYKANFQDPGMKNVMWGRISGSSDGRMLSVLLGGYRDKNSIMDQWYTESNDGGKTWLPLKKIPRADMNDDCGRTGTGLLSIAESGRVFVFYLVYCPTNRGLRMATKAPHSTVFSNEVEIIHGGVTGRPLATQYTIENGQQVMHVFCGKEGENRRLLTHISSRDNGATWSSPKVISGEGYYSPNSLLASTTNQAFSPGVFGIYLEELTRHLQLFYTFDHGATFGRVEASGITQGCERDTYHIAALAVCGTKARPLLYTLVEAKSDELTYTVWDLKTMTGTKMTHPFVGLDSAMGVRLTCVSSEINKQTVVTAIVPVILPDRTEHLLLAQDILPLVSE